VGRIVLTGGIAMALGAAAAASAAERCSLPHMHVIRQTATARVFSLPAEGQGDATRQLYGCLRARPPVKLATDYRGRTIEYSQTNSTFRLGGSAVAWVYDDYDTESGHALSIEIRSLGDVRRSLSLRVFVGTFDPAAEQIRALAVGPHGDAAWLLTGTEINSEIDGIAGSATGVTVVAYGGRIAPGSLVVGRGSVTYTRNGKRRTTPLAAPAPLPRSGRAGPQALDGGFGRCGTLTTGRGGQASELARTPEGLLVAGGYTGMMAEPPDRTSFVFNTIILSRFTESGELDAGFGTAGVSRSRPVGPHDLHLGDLVVGRGGAISVSATANLDGGDDYEATLVLRYDATGKLDASFGQGGVVRDPLGTGDAAVISALAAAPDGGVYLTGERQGRFYVARLRADGALDDGFGAGGVATIRGLGDSAGWALLLAPDGSVAAGGWAGLKSMFARFDAAGSVLSTSYLDPRASAAIGALAALPAGGFAAAGEAVNVAGGEQLLLARYRPDGLLDHSFGDAGITVDRELYRGRSVAVAPDGGWLVGAEFVTHGQGPVSIGDGIVRYRADGRRDAGFGLRGALGESSADSDAGDVLLGADGTAFLAGGPHDDFAVSRFALAQPALADTASQPLVCDVRVRGAITETLNDHRIAAYVRIVRPGRVTVRITLRVGSRTASVPAVTRSYAVAGERTALLTVGPRGLALLRHAKRATVTVTAARPGDPPLQRASTIRRYLR
jgi:uncharacterized delta-60 repeat protein